MSDTAIDLQKIRREIEAEVRARRATGEYPAGFNRELDELFARFSPPEASDDFDAALERAEEAISIELAIPTASNKRALGQFKRGMSKLLSWYHVFVVQQVGALGASITHALRLLGNRVDDLERTSGHTERARAEGARVAASRDDTAWERAVVRALSECNGRVAVCESGDGALLATLTASGIDAYGVEPRFDVADAAIANGLEVRVDDVTGHLRAVAPGDLDGVVLRACVERLPVGEALDLLDLAASRLAPNGTLVVTSLSPAAWGRGRTEVEADLAPGRPLHAATWVDVMQSRQFVDVTSEAFRTEPHLAELPASHPDSALLNETITRISGALFGPDAYVVVGRRARS